jgi:hypothetical protein
LATLLDVLSSTGNGRGRRDARRRYFFGSNLSDAEFMQ